jgi:hypothetical protein
MDARLRHVVAFALAVFFMAFSGYVLRENAEADELLGLWDVDAGEKEEMPRQRTIPENRAAGLVERESLTLDPADNLKQRADLMSLLNDYGVPGYIHNVSPDLGEDPAAPDVPIQIQLDDPEG